MPPQTALVPKQQRTDALPGIFGLGALVAGVIVFARSGRERKSDDYEPTVSSEHRSSQHRTDCAGMQKTCP
jgi:hypothetical protein